MLDKTAEDQPDRTPAILVCIYDSTDPVWSLLNGDTAGAWSMLGARLHPPGEADPSVLAQVITGEIDEAECRAVLLVGRTRRSDGFRVQMRAENRALLGGQKLSQTGPALARATAPVAEMVRALNDSGMIAEATSDCEEDMGSYLLYRVLTALPDNADAPAVGLLRVPFGLNADGVRKGVRCATAAMTRHLSPLPRARSN